MIPQLALHVAQRPCYPSSISGVKVSVSLPDDDVAFLDRYADEQRLASRSAALHQAVRLLRGVDLAPQYEVAFDECDDSGGDDAWDVTTGDGIR